MPTFGKETREQEFMLTPNHCHVNHGSYGAVPKKVFENRLKLLKNIETAPDAYYRWGRPRFWKENIEAAAEFVGSEPDNIALVLNTTYGMNSIMKSIPLKKGDGILIYSWSYKGVENICKSTAYHTGAKVFTVDLRFPIRNVQQDVINKYKKMLLKHPEIKVVLVELINCITGIMMPLDDIIKLCKQHDVLIVVDGAHGPGQIDLKLDQMGKRGVDFFVGNFHKWCYAYRGCAVLWVNPRHHNLIRPALTSIIYQSGNFQNDFIVQGTRDETCIFSVKAALDFYREMGGMDAIVGYNSKLLKEAVALLTEAWGTEACPVPDEMYAPNMRLVRLPDIKKYTMLETDNLYEDMCLLEKTAFTKFHVTAMCVFLQGEPWIRVSANIYNDIDDYKRLAQMMQVLRKVDREDVIKNVH